MKTVKVNTSYKRYDRLIAGGWEPVGPPTHAWEFGKNRGETVAVYVSTVELKPPANKPPSIESAVLGVIRKEHKVWAQSFYIFPELAAFTDHQIHSGRSSASSAKT